ncbi:MAG: hydroxyphenylacetyl-CoA thioesterase PaaI [Acidimicrobiales bacterium]
MDPDRVEDESPAIVAVREMFAADRASQGLGIEIIDLAVGHATASMTVTADMLNGHGTCHGGYIFLLADTALSLACNSYGQVTVAAQAEVTFVAPVGEGDRLDAVARERTRFGRRGIFDVVVRRHEDDDVVAEFRGHSYATPHRLGHARRLP